MGTLFFGISANSITAYAVPKDGDILIYSEGGVNEGIFSEKDGLWQPGIDKTNGFFIENSSQDDIKIKKINLNHISLTNYKANKLLTENDKEYKKTMENCSITISHDGKEIFKGDLNKAFDKNGIKFDNELLIKNGSKENLQMNFSIDKEADNDLQALTNEFNISITYELADNNSNGNTRDGDKPNNGGNRNNPSNGGNSNSSTNKSDMPKTGALVGTAVSALLGIGVISLGTFFVIKNKKKDGDNNE